MTCENGTFCERAACGPLLGDAMFGSPRAGVSLGGRGASAAFASGDCNSDCNCDCDCDMPIGVQPTPAPAPSY